ncbi:MAG: GntR family transcriptional regulator [Pseudorhodobacter sp.]|nr:GntR family transcriptional regulator [Pseudorhodobacter sp.]
MNNLDSTTFYAPAAWQRDGRGPRYLQLYRHIGEAIRAGRLEAAIQLPAERDLAILAAVSRVTVRKAVARLVSDGLVEQKRGAGSFVRPQGPKLEQSLSTLTSFTQYMQQRGKASTSQVLQCGLFAPSPDEQVSLGLSALDRVARVARLRSADGTPMAIERSSLPEDILPHPERVETSLYTVLRASGAAPSRAVQRITAINLAANEARLLNLVEGTAALRIDRTGYLPSGRPIEFTCGIYRSDIYDFVAELRLDSRG